MPFNTSLSGLRAASQDLAVTGNNIANASTTGFKQSRAEFGDVYANSILGSGSRTPGSGVLVNRIAQQFGQGNINITNNSLDLAVNGSGFFITSDQGSLQYTRAGSFGLDNQGYIVASNNARLQGIAATQRGQILRGALADLRLQTSDISPSATTEVDLRFNLDSGTTAVGGRAATLAGSAAPASADFSGTPRSFTINMTGGLSQIVTLNTNLSAPGALAAEIQAQIDSGPLDGLVDVSVDGAGVVGLTQTGPFGGQSLSVAGADATYMLGTPVATAGTVNTPFNPADPTTYNWSTAATIYDSLGNPHVMTSYYVKTDAVVPGGGTEWSGYSDMDSSGSPHALGTLRFNTGGGLISVTTAGGGASTSPTLSDTWPASAGADAMSFNLNLNGSTQFGSEFTVNALDQDGYAPGRLAGINIDGTGIVFAR